MSPPIRAVGHSQALQDALSTGILQVSENPPPTQRIIEICNLLNLTIATHIYILWWLEILHAFAKSFATTLHNAKLCGKLCIFMYHEKVALTTCAP